MQSDDKELEVRVLTSGNREMAAVLVAILVTSTHQTKPIFKLGREIDKSNAYMRNLKKNWVKRP